MIVDNLKAQNDPIITEMTKVGFSVDEMASYLDCKIPVIRYRLRVLGLKAHRKFIVGVHDEKIIELRSKGLTQIQIASIINISQAYVSERMIKLKGEEQRQIRINKWKGGNEK